MLAESKPVIVPEFKKPTAVLSDVDMPCINGHQLALEVRKKYHSLKIVFLTGKADHDHYEFAARNMCVTLKKPYHPEELVALIHALAAGEEGRKNE